MGAILSNKKSLKVRWRKIADANPQKISLTY